VTDLRGWRRVWQVSDRIVFVNLGSSTDSSYRRAVGGRNSGNFNVAHIASPLGMRIGRYPGPVWTLIVFTALAGGNMLFAILFPGNNKPPSLATTTTSVIMLGAAFLLLLLAYRTPGWLLHLVIVVSIGLNAWDIYDSLTTLGPAVFAYSYVLICMYAAYWTSRRYALMYFAMIAVSFLAVLYVRGDLPVLLVLWLVSMSICGAIVLLLSYIVNHLGTLATVDPLTGVLNRIGLSARLDGKPALGGASQSGVMVVIDLDDFKSINDTHGHLYGDQVLRDFGAVIQANLRADDIVARTGGDEFMLILPATTLNDAHGLLARLRTQTTTRWSFGLATWPVGADFDAVMARADQQMYEDKSRPRDL